MARQPRIEFAGAFYHVMCRGDRGERIFEDDEDRRMFLRALAQCCERGGWRLYAWALMTNHYHWVLQTPEANLVAGMKLFVHAGHNAISEATRLARHAQAIGADAVATIAPGFFKPNGLDGLVDWCAPIAAAAPNLPFYFYHMPSMNGVNVNITEFLPRAAERIPNLAGVKFTHEAMGDYLTALQFDGGRFDVLWGRDEMLLGALAMGAEGGVGSTYNVIAPLYVKLIAAFRRNDLQAARELQTQSIAFINRLVSTGNFFAALKAALRAQGVPITPTVRPPLAPVAEAQLTGIQMPDVTAKSNHKE